MSLTSSLATQSAIMRANQAEAAIIRSNQAQQDLIGRGGSYNSISRRESQIETERIKAQTQARASRAELKALKKKKSSRNKLDVLA